SGKRCSTCGIHSHSGTLMWAAKSNICHSSMYGTFRPKCATNPTATAVITAHRPQTKRAANGRDGEGSVTVGHLYPDRPTTASSAEPVAINTGRARAARH